MAKGMLARYKSMNGKKSAQIQVLKSAYKNYSPSLTNSLTVAGGGFVAGAVSTGQFIPDEVAGISTPLLIGGLLASYGIFAGKDGSPSNDMVAKAAVNLGNGMISFWAGNYARDMVQAQAIISPIASTQTP